MEITAALIMIFIAIWVPILLAIVIGFTIIPNSVEFMLWNGSWGQSLNLTTSFGGRITNLSLGYDQRRNQSEYFEVVIVRWIIKDWRIQRLVSTCRVILGKDLKIISCNGCARDPQMSELWSGSYRLAYDPASQTIKYVFEKV